jgi:hypothetical protein
MSAFSLRLHELDSYGASNGLTTKLKAKVRRNIRATRDSWSSNFLSPVKYWMREVNINKNDLAPLISSTHTPYVAE